MSDTGLVDWASLDNTDTSSPLDDSSGDTSGDTLDTSNSDSTDIGSLVDLNSFDPNAPDPLASESTDTSTTDTGGVDNSGFTQSDLDSLMTNYNGSLPTDPLPPDTANAVMADNTDNPLSDLFDSLLGVDGSLSNSGSGTSKQNKTGSGFSFPSIPSGFGFGSGQKQQKQPTQTTVPVNPNQQVATPVQNRNFTGGKTLSSIFGNTSSNQMTTLTIILVILAALTLIIMIVRK